MNLTAEDRELRQFSIGGSDATIIASGDKEAIDRLWMEKRGMDVPRETSLPMEMGTFTEEFNRRWFTQETGRFVVRIGERQRHPQISWLTATIDGMAIESEPYTNDDAAIKDMAVFEAKHVNPFNFNLDDVVAHYMPQLQHNCFVVGASKAVLSILIGTMNWRCQWVDFDPLYHGELLAAERAFWRSVQDGTPPDGWSAGEQMHPADVDMNLNLGWSGLAARYIHAKTEVEKTTEGLRSMIPPKVQRAFGGGVNVQRDARGTPRISIKGER